MSREWTLTLLPASWNGVPFYVESDGETVGHRLVTTAIPNGGYVVEAFGRKLREFKITAYVAADAIEGLGQALLAACEPGRVGLLVLPMAGFVPARMKEAKRNYRHDQLGYLAFDLEAQEEWAAGPGLSANALRSTILNTLVPALSTAVAAGFTARLAPAGGSSLAIDRTQALGVQAVAHLAALRDRAAMAPEPRAAFNASLAGVASVVGTLPGGASGFAMAVLEAGSLLGELADPVSVQLAVDGLAAPAAPWAPKWALSGATIGAVDTAFAVLVDVARLNVLAEAMTARTFAARPEAVAARGQFAAAVERALQALAGVDAEAAALLAQLGAAMSSFLGVIATDLAPLVRVATAVPLPSLWWAWYLHGDLAPEMAMIDRAGAANPLFMPEAFQTVAPNGY